MITADAPGFKRGTAEGIKLDVSEERTVDFKLSVAGTQSTVEVTAAPPLLNTTDATIAGLGLARVGDVVTYDDGSEAVIIEGAGFAAVYDGKPLALVCSRLSNGDRIVESSQDRAAIVVPHGKLIDGLFDPRYVAPAFTAEGA